jgi:hypothetical protein
MIERQPRRREGANKDAKKTKQRVFFARSSRFRAFAVALALSVTGFACREKPRQYGVERQLYLPADQPAVWAVAPAGNLSGVGAVDPLLQADLLYGQLQTVNGIKVVPVNRVIDAFAALGVRAIDSPETADAVCEALGVDALVVATVTAYDPYNPPKMGVSLQLFRRSGGGGGARRVDPRMLARSGSADAAGESQNSSSSNVRESADLVQVVGMYDAASGSVREKLLVYADGRNDPVGPLGAKEYLVSSDRFAGFVYHDLIEQLLVKLQQQEQR